MENDEKDKVPIYLKYAIRCLTSCMRSNQGLLRLVSYQSGKGVHQVVEFLELTNDEEVQANCAKIIRISLRDELVSRTIIWFVSSISSVFQCLAL